MALWRKISRAQDPEARKKAMETFLKRRFHVKRTDRIPRQVAGKVITSLRAMNEREVQRRSGEEKSRVQAEL
jgi:hypothetical protein